MWLLLTRTRFGTLVRAATQDREMVSALGVNQAWLFTAVFALGAMLAGLGGALQLPREPATLEMDLNTIGAAFVVVVVGGMGSIPGAYVAALLIAEIKAVCIWLGVVDVFGIAVSFSKLTLVVDFLVMAVVLVWRPWGLFGRPQAPSRYVRHAGGAAARAPAAAYLLAAGAARPGCWSLLPLAARPTRPTRMVLVIDLLIAALFAASLHFIMGPAGMHSFGHAAYFGLGAYGAALLVRASGMPMELALLARAAGGGGRRAGLRLVRGAAVGRVPGHADAGLRADHLGRHLPVGQPSPAAATASPASGRPTGCRTSGPTTGSRWRWWRAGVLWLRRVLFSPFGYALRAGARLAAARRRHRHRRQAHAVGGLRDRRRGGRAGRRALCVLQGQHLARVAVRSASRSTGW